jgi:hypothetical protein
LDSFDRHWLRDAFAAGQFLQQVPECAYKGILSKASNSASAKARNCCGERRNT